VGLAPQYGIGDEPAAQTRLAAQRCDQLTIGGDEAFVGCPDADADVDQRD
jgi:hypothetical protein